jgi:thioredoxin reductase (NADPH)
MPESGSAVYEIAIVGAGPAGLSAALYAARFCRSVLVLHDGHSRAWRIARTYNVPGFDDGITGPELIARMTRHASQYGAQFVDARVATAVRKSGNFELADAAGRIWQAQALILATGINLNQIPLDEKTHEAAIAHDVLRYCPICDGYEHRGKRIAVVGCDISGAGEALFLRQFSDDITLLPKAEAELTAKERADLAAAGVQTIVAPITRYAPQSDTFDIYVEGEDSPLSFDVLYPALGVTPRNELAAQLALPLDECGNTDPASPFGTRVPGLFCAGDLVEGLDQVTVAIGHGAIAATKAHNWLRDQDGATVEAVLED